MVNLSKIRYLYLMMKNRIKRFKHLPIQKQFILISAVSIVLVVFLSVFSIASINGLMLSTASEHADLATDRFSNDLDSLLTKLDVITTSFQTDSIYKTLFNATDYKDISSDIINQVSENVSYIKSLYPDIADIAFVNNVVHWSSLYSEEDLLSMYKETVSNGKNLNRGLGLKKSSFLPFKDKSYYVYCSQTYYLGHPIGCIFFSLDMDKLSLTSSSNENAYYYLMDTNGNYHALNSSSKSVSQAIIPICQANYSKVTEGSSFSNKSKSYLIKMDYSSTASCYIISAVNITSVNKSSQGTLIKVTMIVVAIVFFVLLMLITLYVSLINPLNQFSNIIKTMEKERTRHLSAPIDIDGCMEVHDLGTAFTNMFSTIDELNVQIFDASSKLYEEKIRGQATEISYFRSQINPHFLYNVLELIRSQALLKDAPEIANIAIAMGKMYRYNTKGAPIVPFKDELEVTKAYVEIQKYRFKDKFDIFYNIPEEALKYRVIKMILQPLVENAIGHGIEPSLEKCTLYIGVNIKDTDLYIDIRDDGVGMSEEKLKEIRSLLSEKHIDSEKYVGILNTNARIKLQYGEEYGINIDSNESDGTVVQLHLPLER